MNARIRRCLVLAVGLLLLVLGPGGSTAVAPALAQEPGFVVTNAGDAEEAVCPDEAACTLRRAIEAANADESETALQITFDPAVFPPSEPETITLTQGRLPALTATFTQILAADAGVILDGEGNTGLGDGLVLEGDNTAVRGLAIVGFPGGACVATAGEDVVIGGGAAADGNVLGSCAEGVHVASESAFVAGNVIGFAVGTVAAPVTTGILVGGDNVLATGNTIGHASDAIRLETGELATITGNAFGTALNDEPAPIGRGIVIAATAGPATVTGNEFANAGTAIVVSPDTGGASSVGNVFRTNTYESLTRLEIDLGDTGERNVNDPGDEDTGPNGLLNSPTFATITQSVISGSACAGCTVDIYLTQHTPGGAGDHATVPVSGGTTTASVSGAFSFVSPPLTPGQWISAIVTHPVEGTSDFSAPVRLGSGIIQCGNVALAPGWNHSGYFGGSPFSLNSTFPPGDPGAVDLIREYIEDGETFIPWIAGGGPSTLKALNPGTAYWYHAIEPTTVPGGLALTVPVPVELSTGWNDFVYLGATESVADALISLDGEYEAIYQWVADETGGRWLMNAGDALPGWANTLTAIEACGTYQVQMTAAKTLEPLQP